jgi:hypothetical protein
MAHATFAEGIVGAKHTLPQGCCLWENRQLYRGPQDARLPPESLRATSGRLLHMLRMAAPSTDKESKSCCTTRSVVGLAELWPRFWR